MKRSILLIGFMGVGKSTVSMRLSQMLQVDEMDTDAYIVAEEKMSIPEIFETKGEPYFRNLETELLRHLPEMNPMIVSCGGGMALREENATIMKENGYVVWLTARPDTILARVMDDDQRPLLRGNKNIPFIANLLEVRSPKYQAAAHVRIETDDRSIESICDEIIAFIKEDGML